MKPGPRSFRLCLYLKRVVSNQTAFPSTVHSQRERGRERERERKRERNCLILIWPCIVFHGALIYVRKGRVPFWGSNDIRESHFLRPHYHAFHTQLAEAVFGKLPLDKKAFLLTHLYVHMPSIPQNYSKKLRFFVFLFFLFVAPKGKFCVVV